jgi:hypothetical protein
MASKDIDNVPLEVAIPKVTTHRTFENTDADRSLVICENANDMFSKLGI